MVELIVVMGIITLLISLALPAVGRAREAARRTQCMNNVRNLAFALIQFEHYNGRFPASGYLFDPPGGGGGPHHNWAVSILPFVDGQNLYNQWDFEKPVTAEVNKPLTKAHVPAFICPVDISRNDEKQGDLSYAVNGGWGFTMRTGAGVRDCPVDWHGRRLDLNGDGATCTGADERDDADRAIFDQLGLFFLENWKIGTERHHSAKDITDGTTQTFLLSENARTGFDPDNSGANFADPNPYRCAFYIGNPCLNGNCSPGNVDYSRSNAGEDRINSGLWSAEGSSPFPNSFHSGGVMMAYADSHVRLLFENVDGRVYAALASPQGGQLEGTPLAQGIVSGGEF